MVSINITISKKAYDFLKSIKGEKSFSEIILQFQKETDLLKYAGSLKGSVLKEDFKRYSHSIKESFNKRF